MRKNHMDNDRARTSQADFAQELLVRHEYLHEQNQVAIRERDDARTWALKWREEQTRYEKVLNTMERVIVSSFPTCIDRTFLTPCRTTTPASQS